MSRTPTSAIRSSASSTGGSSAISSPAGSFLRIEDYEEMMNKASCLSLLCNAVLVWNTVHMSRIIEQLRATGVTITDEEVALSSPLAYAHVIPNGTYFFDRSGEEEASAQSRNP
jgi:hypothetical protein